MEADKKFINKTKCIQCDQGIQDKETIWCSLVNDEKKNDWVVMNTNNEYIMFAREL